MNLLAMTPLWARVAALLALAAALLGFGWVHGARHVQTEWYAASAATVRAEAQAVQLRLTSNAKLAAQQAAINKTITEGKDHEIAALSARLAASGRLRVGPAICGGPATPAETPSASSGDAADPPGGLVRDDADRDLKALIVAAEVDLATGRACQAFVRENGLAP